VEKKKQQSKELKGNWKIEIDGHLRSLRCGWLNRREKILVFEKVKTVNNTFKEVVFRIPCPTI
jgi:hypothetical protein